MLKKIFFIFKSEAKWITKHNLLFQWIIRRLNRCFDEIKVQFAIFIHLQWMNVFEKIRLKTCNKKYIDDVVDSSHLGRFNNVYIGKWKFAKKNVMTGCSWKTP